MIFTYACESCNRFIKLDYDEEDSTPSHCPFCGESLADGGEFEDDRIDFGDEFSEDGF